MVGEAEEPFWFVVVRPGRDGYRSVFGDRPQLQIHSRRRPLPSPLPVGAVDELRFLRLPEEALAGGDLDVGALVRAGWVVCSVLSG